MSTSISWQKKFEPDRLSEQESTIENAKLRAMYEHMSDEQLAQSVSDIMGLEYETSLKAVRSKNPNLGREWALRFLRREAKWEEAKARLSEQLDTLRSIRI
jgi:hypothetical protein